jgi:hypothetical protein
MGWVGWQIVVPRPSASASLTGRRQKVSDKAAICVYRRRKREADAPKTDKVDKMIDVMNELNQAFGKFSIFLLESHLNCFFPLSHQQRSSRIGTSQREAEERRRIQGRDSPIFRNYF